MRHLANYTVRTEVEKEIKEEERYKGRKMKKIRKKRSRRRKWRKGQGSDKRRELEEYGMERWARRGRKRGEEEKWRGDEEEWWCKGSRSGKGSRRESKRGGKVKW